MSHKLYFDSDPQSYSQIGSRVFFMNVCVCTVCVMDNMTHISPVVFLNLKKNMNKRHIAVVR